MPATSAKESKEPAAAAGTELARSGEANDTEGRTSKEGAASSAISGTTVSHESALSGWGSFWTQIKAKSEGLERQLGTYLEEVPSNAKMKERFTKWGSMAGQYIDQADKRIEELEIRAGSYLKTVGTDLKSIVDVQLERPEAAPQAGSTLFTADRHINTSRLDTQLYALHTTPEKVLRHPASTRKWGARQKEADALLAATPELRSLHTDLVPAKLDEAQFWLRYFELRDDTVASDRKRKELLATQRIEEEASWSSSDEEAEPDTAVSSAPVTTNRASGAADSHADSQGNYDVKIRSKAAVEASEVSLTGETASAEAVVKADTSRDSDSDWD